MRRYNLAFAYAKVCQEIIDYVEQSVEDSEYLTKKEKDELPNKVREAIS